VRLYGVKEKKNELLKKQTYKFDDRVFKVEPVFKEQGERTLLKALGQMINKDSSNL